MAKTKGIKLTDKTKKIIMYSSLGLIAVFVIMQIVKKKKDQETGGGSEDDCGGRYKDNSEYGQKVMKVQSNVGISGCDVDGIVGNQTNGAVKSKYPKLYSRYGGVTSANIDIYLDGNRLEAQQTGTTTRTYTDKVKELQRKLNLPTQYQTGFAGDITNNELKRKYPSYYNNYGRISEGNIDTYLNIVTNNPVFG
jgi:hypothetical protein